MNDAVNLLVIDDEAGIRDLLVSELGGQGYHVTAVGGGPEAMERIQQERFDIVISDVNMPRMNGLQVLEAVKTAAPEIEVILTTGYGTIDMAVEAMKLGAYDFVEKPFSVEELFVLIQKALERSEMKAILGIHEMSRAIFASMKPEVLVPIAARLAAQILKADDVSIMLHDPQGTLAVQAAYGLEDDARLRSRLALGERVAGKVAQLKEPVVIQGTLASDSRFAGIDGLRDIRSSIVFPLLIEGNLLGVLNANRTSRKESFGASELRHADIFGSQIAQALHNARLYQALERKIQEIQDMQGHLIQSEKLAAVGQLVSGIAHEINNPMTGIMGFTELLLRGDGLNEEQREDLESILKQAKRCREIVQNLLQFSRKTSLQLERVSLKRVLETTLEFSGMDKQSPRASIRMEIPEPLPDIQGNASQLGQVFLNITTNARQAMNGRPGSSIVIRGLREGERILLRFEDNGPGIAPENIGKVFDPFFTTKPVGKGTGLGLSISYGIIQQHGGTMRVESQVGVGTAFIISLPAGTFSDHEGDKEYPGR